MCARQVDSYADLVAGTVRSVGRGESDMDGRSTAECPEGVARQGVADGRMGAGRGNEVARRRQKGFVGRHEAVWPSAALVQPGKISRVVGGRGDGQCDRQCCQGRNARRAKKSLPVRGMPAASAPPPPFLRGLPARHARIAPPSHSSRASCPSPYSPLHPSRIKACTAPPCYATMHSDL